MSIELKSRELEDIELQRPICLPEAYAMGLQRLAEDKSMPADALLEQALRRLFQQEMDADTYSAWDYLRETEAEFGLLLPSRPLSKPIDIDKITEIIEIRIAPEKIRRFGEKI